MSDSVSVPWWALQVLSLVVAAIVLWFGVFPIFDFVEGRLMSKHSAVGVRDLESGKVTICARAEMPGDYETLCGNSLSDDTMTEAPIAVNAKIECRACYAVWREAQRFNAKDFK